MTTIDTRAAALCEAWRNAHDLAPIVWALLTERERSVWRSVAAATGAPAAPEGEQWTVAVVAGKGARTKPQIVLTSPNAELVLSGETFGPTAAQELVDAGLRGFRIE